VKFAKKDEIIDTNSIKSKQSNNFDSIGTLTMQSKLSTPKRSPIKPISVGSFIFDKEITPFRPVAETNTPIKEDDLIS
jgi:hypothetical protein